MTQPRLPESISIRPGVSVLSVLQHLNYKPWFAIAEFVDNSLQSFLSHRQELARHGPRPEGEGGRCPRRDLSYDSGRCRRYPSR